MYLYIHLRFMQLVANSILIGLGKGYWLGEWEV